MSRSMYIIVLQDVAVPYAVELGLYNSHGIPQQPCTICIEERKHDRVQGCVRVIFLWVASP